MKIITFIALIFLAVLMTNGSNVQAEEGLTGQGVLATAKFAGACGILDSMIHFQKTTKMSGGDEFVSRFWAVESARLGLSVQEMSDSCNKAVSLYDNLWKSMEKEAQ